MRVVLFAALLWGVAFAWHAHTGTERALAAPIDWETVIQWIYEDAAVYGVSGAWLEQVAWCESRGDVWAVGRLGEIGPAQFHPAGIWWALPQSRLVPLDFSAQSIRLQVQAMAYAFASGLAFHWSCAR